MRTKHNQTHLTLKTFTHANKNQMKLKAHHGGLSIVTKARLKKINFSFDSHLFIDVTMRKKQLSTDVELDSANEQGSYSIWAQ